MWQGTGIERIIHGVADCWRNLDHRWRVRCKQQTERSETINFSAPRSSLRSELFRFARYIQRHAKKYEESGMYGLLSE